MKRQTLLSFMTFVTAQWIPATSSIEIGVQYNMTEYWKMPALFQYESIEDCLRSNPAGVFCVVKSVVKPDERSSIWRTIEEYSQYPFQHQHSILTRGVCLEQCEELVKTLSDQQRAQFLQPKFDIKYKVNNVTISPLITINH
ncbi:uncharacterized protein LOC131694746 [Topomyia yanbarensis]|uniref:uncharacterized protein LOC131684824 n=1 Tax=Topomyia yanbarensis TaxID=2498891 RepID=UPI00273C7A14|nr:uncharacterized protein LOC131684824 [Topomyia yanbarensis]XP_058839218.1 uncharacterized protein LOC131694746 [Topomyia yanbarensis]